MFFFNQCCNNDCNRCVKCRAAERDNGCCKCCDRRPQKPCERPKCPCEHNHDNDGCGCGKDYGGYGGGKDYGYGDEYRCRCTCCRKTNNMNGGCDGKYYD